jgi:preprotein translocase subunit SecG
MNQYIKDSYANVSGRVNSVLHPIDSISERHLPKLKEFFKQAGEENFLERNAVLMIPLFVITIMSTIMLIFYTFLRGPPEQHDASDALLANIISVTGLVFAISGIYSVPYLTKNAFKRTISKYSNAYDSVYGT